MGKKLVMGDENVYIGEDGKGHLSFPGLGLGKGVFTIAPGAAKLLQKEECILSADGETLYCFTLREGKKDRIQVPEGVKRIGAYAGKGIEEVGEMLFPDSLEEIEEEAFSTVHFSQVVRLPEGLIRIGEDAFGAGNKIFLPKSLKEIGEGSLYGFEEIYAYQGSAGLSRAICHRPFCCQDSLEAVKMAYHRLHLHMPEDGNYHTMVIPYLLTRRGVMAMEEVFSGKRKDLSGIFACYREYEEEIKLGLEFYISLRGWCESFGWDFSKDIKERIESISANLALEYLKKHYWYGKSTERVVIEYCDSGRVSAPYLSAIMYYAEEENMRDLLWYCRKQGASSERYRHTLEVQEKAAKKREALRDTLWAVEHHREEEAMRYLDEEEFTEYGRKKILEAANANGMHEVAAKILEMDKDEGKKRRFPL